MVLVFCTDCKRWYDAYLGEGCKPRTPGWGSDACGHRYCYCNLDFSKEMTGFVEKYRDSFKDYRDIDRSQK